MGGFDGKVRLPPLQHEEPTKIPPNLSNLLLPQVRIIEADGWRCMCTLDPARRKASSDTVSRKLEQDIESA